MKHKLSHLKLLMQYFYSIKQCRCGNSSQVIVSLDPTHNIKVLRSSNATHTTGGINNERISNHI